VARRFAEAFPERQLRMTEARYARDETHGQIAKAATAVRTVRRHINLSTEERVEVLGQRKAKRG
jgi:hypothetical protein